MVAITRLRISPCDPAGAGRCTLTMVPGGVITSMGRNEPWFSGACGSNTDFTVMKHARRRHRRRRVDREGHLRRGAGEIGDHPVAFDGERQRKKQRLEAAAHECLEIVLVVAGPVRHGGDAGPHARLGTVEIEADGLQQRVDAIAGADLVDALLRDAAGGEARLEVAEPLVGNAHVGEQEVERGLVHPPAFQDLERRDADALLVDLGRLAGHAAGHHAADVGPVGAHRRKEDQPAIAKDRIDDGHVVEMSAAGIGIVHENDVTRGERGAHLLHRRAHRPRHRHHVRADVLRLGDDLAVRREQPAGEVLGVVDGDRASGAAYRGAHLAHGGDQRLGQDFQRDRIEGGRHGSAPAQDETADGVELRVPAGRNDGGRAVLLDQRRTLHCLARRQAIASKYRHLLLLAVENHGTRAGDGRLQRSSGPVNRRKLRLVR